MGVLSNKCYRPARVQCRILVANVVQSLYYNLASHKQHQNKGHFI